MRVTAEIILIMIVVVALVVYGSWKLSQAENTDFKAFVTKAEFIENEFPKFTERITKVDEALANLGVLVADAIKKCGDNDKEMEKIQDHLARVREQQQRPQKMFLSAKQAIPVEIINSNKKDVVLKPDDEVLRSVRKKIRELSK